LGGGTQLAMTGWCARLRCHDVYREAWADNGLYWELRVADPEQHRIATPDDPTVWTFDIWTARAEEFGYRTETGEFVPIKHKRKIWEAQMTEARRAEILAIKHAVCSDKRYKSFEVYEAVLECGVCGVDTYWQWWQAKHDRG
jgi:hypothetical protein